MAKKKTAAKKKKTAAKKKPARRAKKPAMEMLIVGSKSKAVIKDNGMNVAGDALEGLNSVVYWYLQQACLRAAANGRKTVRAHDFTIM